VEGRTSRVSDFQALIATGIIGREGDQSSNPRTLLFLYDSNLRAVPLAAISHVTVATGDNAHRRHPEPMGEVLIAQSRFIKSSAASDFLKPVNPFVFNKLNVEFKSVQRGFLAILAQLSSPAGS
jgi:hypothetical protein